MKWELIESAPRVGQRKRQVQVQCNGQLVGFVAVSEEELADLERRLRDRRRPSAEEAIRSVVDTLPPKARRRRS
jgi:hypothetical protein